MQNERENTMMTRAELEAAVRSGANLGGRKGLTTGVSLNLDLGGRKGLTTGVSLNLDLGGRKGLTTGVSLNLDLGGADLGDQWIIQGAARSDGYPFFLQMLTGDKVPMVKAGCRLLTLSQAWKHWHETRAGQVLLRETIAIIGGMVELAVIRGYVTREPNGAINAIKLPK
jgi:hypothetical protein